MKVYDAHSSPVKSIDGIIYNFGGQAVWDCKCGETAIPAGGQHEHECPFTIEEQKYKKINEELNDLLHERGTATEHPNIFEIDSSILNEFEGLSERHAFLIAKYREQQQRFGTSL
jgi:hypothetical protein